MEPGNRCIRQSCIADPVFFLRKDGVLITKTNINMKIHTQLIGAAIISMSLLGFGLNTDHKTPPNCSGTTLENKEVVYADFYYDLSPRFEPISKSKLHQATSVADFFETENLRPLANYESIEVVIIENDKQTEKRISNEYYTLSEKQVEMLLTFDYSTHFLIRAVFQENNEKSGEMEYFRAEPHFTVVPEKQATYEFSEEGLIDYITKSNKENTANLDESKLQFAKLYFTVTQDGTLTNIYLDRSSGYKKIDKAMIELLTNAPGKWTPAENPQGEKLEQELVVTFGVGGC